MSYPAPRGLTVEEAARLVAWKLLGRARHLADRHGGLDRAHRRADEWAARSLGAHASIAEWLRRPAGGRLWVHANDAREWAIAGYTPLDREIADVVLEGRARLLGADRRLHGAPRWRTDLYSGIEWPLDPVEQLMVVRGDGSDIRTVWEWSRAYHAIPLARCYWADGDSRCARQFASDVHSWASENPPGRGPNWASPMDVGIRAANWALAVVLLADAPEIETSTWQLVLRELWMAAYFVERHLEWHPRYRGNHYLANIVALLYVGALLRDTPQGARWLARGARLVVQEMHYQVGADGVTLEGSLAYHRLVTELFAFAGQVVEANCPGQPGADYWHRLRQMYAFIAAYLPESGEAPMLGDADDGRLHAVSAEGLLEPRRHRLGLPAAFWPAAAQPFAARDGGFYVLRRGRDHCAIRAGAVGLHGAGSHDHNDQLSFELVIAGRRVIADSGTYCYTRDIGLRYLFRSTSAHSVPQLGEGEQNPISVRRPWRVLADRTRTDCVAWRPDGQALTFVGEHRGFEGEVRCRREFLSECEGQWVVRDDLIGTGPALLAWRLHFATPLVSLESVPGRWRLTLTGKPEVHTVVEGPAGLEGAIEMQDRSDRYGIKAPHAVFVLRGSVTLPGMISARFFVEEGA